MLCDNKPQCQKHGADDTSHIIEESANDLSDEFLVFFGEQCGGVHVFHVLCLHSVVGLDVWVWLMLQFVRCLVLELREGLGDVVKH